jgi:ABC-type nitrate/sulfonate/bicarbonate transport system permease component
MASSHDDSTTRLPPWGNLSTKTSYLFTDLPIAFSGMALFYGLLSLARYWTAPVNTQTQIDLSPSALPVYALFSVARIGVAYLLSLAVSLIYGYIAANNLKAERLMIPILDTLQSIPVLCFLPGVMISMVALFPTTQVGVELGSILLIFTGQVWNMAFSVYSSLKNIPREMLEAARVYRLSWWQRLTQLELPYMAIGLIWNSMMSVAGGWFSLMVCEMFVLGNRDLRLPGLGSYSIQQRRDAIHRLGLDRDGRGHRSDRPDRLETHHSVERKIQIRTGGGFANTHLAHSELPTPFHPLIAYRPGFVCAGAGSVDAVFRPSGCRSPSQPRKQAEPMDILDSRRGCRRRSDLCRGKNCRDDRVAHPA